MSSHKDLLVYQKALDLVTVLYAVVAQFPKEEMYALSSQMKRASVSIPSNIAEGAARRYEKDYVRFLFIALGSAAELETQLDIAYNLGFVHSEKHEKLHAQIEEVAKMLQGLIKYQKTKIERSNP